MVESQKHSLHHVFYINESNVLALKSHREIHVVAYAFEHQEIVFLTRSIYARGTENDVRKIVSDAVEIAFSLEFAPSVRRIGLWAVVLGNLLIGFLFVNGTENAQRTQINKAPNRHLQREKGIDKMFRPVGIHAVKIVCPQTFRYAGSVYDIVECMVGELLPERVFRRKVKLDEVNAAVGEVFPRTARSHCGPHLHLSAQGFGHDKAADKTAGACY